MTVRPSWAEQLRSKYLAGESSMFLLHGNVRDLQQWTSPDGDVEWVSLATYLQRFLEPVKEIIVTYDVSKGLQFSKKEHSAAFRTAINEVRSLRGDARLETLPTTANKVVPILEDLITKHHRQSSAVIIDFFETVVPNADMAFMSHDDKANLVSLQRWASDPDFSKTDNIVILITETLSDVSRRITSSTSLVTIDVPYPTEAQRLAFAQSQDLRDINMEIPVTAFAKMTAGLTLTQINSLLKGAQLSGHPINFKDISNKKKKIIEQECQGLVEFVPPRHDFSHVGGMNEAKRILLTVAQAIKNGNNSRVPMGVIFVGGMGLAKTFMAEAFSTESGLTCLKLKNFRDKYVGQTEANLEKVLTLVDALGYVLLVIDEADRGLSGGESDGGVGSRVIARLKEFMSDTSHRGKVVILMMTNRPDKLDVDLKRPGRFDLKIPFFPAETKEERINIFEALVRKNKLVLDEDVSFDFAADQTEGYSGAEIEAILLAAVNPDTPDVDLITQTSLDKAATDVIPSRDNRMRDYMEMLAVFECSAKSMLPSRYRDLTTEQVQEKLDLLGRVVGHRR